MVRAGRCGMHLPWRRTERARRAQLRGGAVAGGRRSDGSRKRCVGARRKRRVRGRAGGRGRRARPRRWRGTATLAAEQELTQWQPSAFEVDSVLVPVAVLLQPWRVHRTGVHRLQPGAAEGGRGQQEHEGKEPAAAQEPDHRRLSYVLRLRYGKWAASRDGRGAVQRTGRDSNPRNAFAVYTLSRRAPSTTRPPVPTRCEAAT